MLEEKIKLFISGAASLDPKIEEKIQIIRNKSSARIPVLQKHHQ